MLEITALAVGAAISVLEPLIRRHLGLEKRPTHTIEQRVQRLSSSLVDASRVINEIEQEIQQRQALVTKLQQDAQVYKEIVDVNRPQVEAISQVLRGELQRGERRAIWIEVAVNFLFFVLGIIVTLVLT